MFATNSTSSMSMMTTPDVCKTPLLVPVPLPYPNITMSTTHIPSVFNVTICDGLAENLLTEGTISMGDEPGVLGGIVSNIFMGPDRYLMGSFKVMFGVAFAARLTSLVGMNGMPFNTVGMAMVPAQCSVLILS
ncbi:DUF4150 domain-containing protein [Burkholderia glumae]